MRISSSVVTAQILMGLSHGAIVDERGFVKCSSPATRIHLRGTLCRKSYELPKETSYMKSRAKP